MFKETPLTDAQQPLDVCRQYADDPRGWLYLYGLPGVGKSHLAAALAQQLDERHAQLIEGIAREHLTGALEGLNRHKRARVLEDAALALVAPHLSRTWRRKLSTSLLPPAEKPAQRVARGRPKKEPTP